MRLRVKTQGPSLGSSPGLSDGPHGWPNVPCANAFETGAGAMIYKESAHEASFQTSCRSLHCHKILPKKDGEIVYKNP